MASDTTRAFPASTDSLGVSPVTATSPSESNFSFAVSNVSTTSTPTLSRSETLPPYTPTPEPSSSSEKPTGKEVVRQIDYDCLPEAVIPDGPELAVVEYSIDRDNLPIPVSSTAQDDKSEYASGLEVMAVHQPVRTVTPLHLLGDQADVIDCPFCLRRSETRVKKKPSNATHLQAVLLLMTTVCGAAAPYVAKWSFDVEQFCQSCNNKVMYKAMGKDVHICKVPISWKEESKYPDATSNTN